MNWSDVMGDPTLQNLPYKIELTRRGTIEMTPASNRRGKLQPRLSYLLRQGMQGGEVVTECSIQTREGVKVADVAWGSDEFHARHGDETPYLEAPEICVEIVSPSNSIDEMREKVELYLEQGAVEVWVVREDGVARFFGRAGELPASSFLDVAL